VLGGDLHTSHFILHCEKKCTYAQQGRQSGFGLARAAHHAPTDTKTRPASSHALSASSSSGVAASPATTGTSAMMAPVRCAPRLLTALRKSSMATMDGPMPW